MYSSPPPPISDRVLQGVGEPLTQAEVEELEAHVDKLQRQLEQSELDCVNSKAQVTTLTRLVSSDEPQQAPQAEQLGRTADDSTQSPASAGRRDPWDMSADECDEVHRLRTHTRP